MRRVRSPQLLLGSFALLLSAACAEGPSSVAAPVASPVLNAVAAGLASSAPSRAVVGGPDLSDFHTFEGQVWICKDGNLAGVSFAFDYVVVRQSDLTVVASGSTTVPVGQCVLATSVATETNGRYRASATETSTLPNWSLTGINWAYGANLPLTPPAPTVDLATRTVSAVLVANDVGVQLTFTNQYVAPPSGEIGDYVWNDTNGNGLQESGEPGLAGRTVTLGGAASATTTTDANGKYLFTGLSAGSYSVSVATPGGMAPTTAGAGSDRAVDSNGSPASVTLATDASVDYSIDFGFTTLATGKIGDYVWYDKDRDGIQEWGEYGISGVVVTLTGPVSATTTTNSGGAYLFTGLPAGTYIVRVTAPSGYVASPSLRGSNRTIDSNNNPATVILATNGSVDLSVDFGFDKPTVVPCVQPTSWWIQNWWEWNSIADGRPLNKYQPFYASGKDNWTMISMSNHYGNAYITLAQELITARLVKHWYESSGIPAVDAAIAGAEAYFAAHPSGISTPSGATKTQLLAWASTLDAWTDGRLATKVCRGSCR